MNTELSESDTEATAIQYKKDGRLVNDCPCQKTYNGLDQHLLK